MDVLLRPSRFVALLALYVLIHVVLRVTLSPTLTVDDARDAFFVALKTVWRDGTSHLLFEPIELLEKLAAIIPRPAVNLVLYHGVLAPHARWRRQAVSYGRPAPDSPPRTSRPAPAPPAPRARGPEPH